MLRLSVGVLLVIFHVAYSAPPLTDENCYYCNQATNWARKILSSAGPAGQVTGFLPQFLDTVADLTCDPFNSPPNCIETAKFIANTIWALGGYLLNPCNIITEAVCKFPGLEFICIICEFCELIEGELCKGEFVPPCRACHATIGCPLPSSEKHCSKCSRLVCESTALPHCCE